MSRKEKQKEWSRKYKHSSKGIKARKKYDRSFVGKAKYKRYRATKKYKIYIRNYYKKIPVEVRKARYYVQNAVRDGRLIRPDRCEKCNKKDWGIKRSMIEAHHYKGYSPEFWLVVRWLCTDCHKEVMSNE
jgi:hypothetical protein